METANQASLLTRLIDFLLIHETMLCEHLIVEIVSLVCLISRLPLFSFIFSAFCNLINFMYFKACGLMKSIFQYEVFC